LHSNKQAKRLEMPQMSGQFLLRYPTHAALQSAEAQRSFRKNQAVQNRDRPLARKAIKKLHHRGRSGRSFAFGLFALRKYLRTVFRDTPNFALIARMLLP
jgi:site-specific recombinase XerC